MTTVQSSRKLRRIAVVSLLRHMDAQRALNGLYRRAESHPDAWIRNYDAEAANFRAEVLDEIRDWRPHGLIVRIADPSRLRQLRRGFPSLPFVSMVIVPPGVVDTVVAGDMTSMLVAVRDFFQKCGVSRMAMFYLTSECAIGNVAGVFRSVVPDGVEWDCPLEVFVDRTPAGKRRQRKIMAEALLHLPKPVGVMTRETEAAAFLLGWCQRLGLRVPEDVQIIGPDEKDQCLACEPQLTSYMLPHECIGEVAMDTVLGLMRGEKPPPILRLRGGIIVPRGTTAIQKVGRPAVASAIARMQADAAQGLSAGDVTRSSKVGQTTFYKHFGATTGNTPGRYLRKIRIEEVCRLLRETDDTVTAISAACEFTSLQGFVNFFRRQTGQTPTQYRQQAQMESGEAGK